ncbi:MAG TPA: hypothetical protein DD381_02445 [Lentisphaeria bacterium]|nr:MAG: hypothetical protein A2X47_08590 [Lentisphaerae bacterium GWF2_38_69]HBM15194.1 hypothetical protein [Lentisphaeria bacterium]
MFKSIIFQKVFLLKNIKIEKYFLLFVLIFGLIYLLVLPPLMAPDELVHFYRPYQISELNFDQSKGIPKSLIDFSNQYFLKMAFQPEKKTSFQELLSSFNQKLNPADKVVSKKEIPSLILPYIPQAIGILLGKAFDAPPILLLYLGRIFNLLTCSIILYFAVKAFPFNKLIMLLLCLMPVTIQQISSLSYDGLTISLSILWLSLIFKFIFEVDSIIHKKEMIWLLFIVILLSFCKTGYAFISALILLIHWKKFSSKSHKWMFACFIIIVSILPLIFPSFYKFFYNPLGMMVSNKLSFSQSYNLDFIISNPFSYMMRYIRTSYLLYFYLEKLGWVDTNLSQLYIRSYLALLIIITIFASNVYNYSISFFQRFFCIALYVTITFFQMLMMHILSPPAPFLLTINGWQGRYFIPIMLLLVPVIMINKNFLSYKYHNLLTICVQLMLFFSFFHTIRTLICRYYI